MQRLRLDPRPDWDAQADSLGFTWRHTGGELYWDETAAYAFTMAEVEDGIEAPTEELHGFCLDLVAEAVQSERLMEQLDIPEIYYSHQRSVFERDGMWLAVGPHSTPRGDEQVSTRTVRYRTVGDMSCTGAVESDAADVAAVLAEVAATRITERGATRADDRLTEAAMEDRKKEGYF